MAIRGGKREVNYAAGYVLAAIGPGDEAEGIAAMRTYISQHGLDADMVRMVRHREDGSVRLEAKVDLYWPTKGKPRIAGDGKGRDEHIQAVPDGSVGAGGTDIQEQSRNVSDAGRPAEDAGRTGSAGSIRRHWLDAC